MERVRMDSFLDVVVIIKYFEYNYIKEKFRERCYNHINSNKEEIIFSVIVQERLKRIIIKRKEIYDMILKKINNPSYEINVENSKFLKKGEILFANSLYLTSKSENTPDLKKKFDSEISFLNYSLSFFLKNSIGEVLIKKEEIDKSLRSVLYDYIEDIEDCEVLASAIQMQQDRKQFLFVTCDKHFIPGSYDALMQDSRMNEHKMPVLKNLLYD